MDKSVAMKKVLQKVRRNFINKAPEDEEPGQHVVGILQHVNDTDIQMIDTSVGIVERNRKICVGDRFLNAHVTVSNIKLDVQAAWKSVTFDIQLHDNIHQLPYEYYARMLESFGDLNLATWAQKIRNHRALYPKIMEQYLTLAKSQDPQLSAKLRKIKTQINLAHEEIASSYPFKCVTLFSNGVATVPIHATYNEQFLQEIGHNLEGFADWVGENGIPKLFVGDSQFHQDIARGFLDCSVYQGEPVKYGHEYNSFIYDKNGTKKQAVIQLVLTVEPVLEGIIVTGYAILKKQEALSSQIKEEFYLKSLKCFKEESALEHSGRSY